MGDHVFVSYARDDGVYVGNLLAHLRAHRVEVWSDEAIYFGADWPAAIQDSIDTCAAFVVVMSPTARASRWVRREVLRAQAKGKPVFPLLLSGEPFFEVSDLQHESVIHGGMPSPRWVAHLLTVPSQPAAGQPSDLPKPAPVVTGGPESARALQVTQAATLTGHTGGVLSVAFSQDGQTLATGSGDCTVGLWELATGRRTATLTGHSRAVWSVAYSQDGHILASGSYDCTVRLWDLVTGRPTATLTGHTEPVRSVAFSQDGHTLATGSDDGVVRLWDVTDGRTASLIDRAAPVLSVAFSRDGHILASGSADRAVHLWDVATCRHMTTLTGHASRVVSVVFAPDGETLATTSDDRTVRLWDVVTGRQMISLTGHTSRVVSVAFSRGGHILASGSADGTARLWELATGPPAPETWTS